MATDIIARALAASGGGGGTTDAYTKSETNALLATKANANMSNIDEDGIAKVKEIIQPELDKKANKTTIETVTSDVNVVTVPENVKDFGMVSMVGGKTVKDGDVLKSAPIEKIVSVGKNLFNGETLFLWGLKKVGDSWIISAADTRNEPVIIGRLYNGNTPIGVSIASSKSGDIYYSKFTKISDADAMTFGHSGSTQDLKIKFDISHLINGENYVVSAKITGTPDVVGSLTISNVMVEHCEKLTDYSPYNKSIISISELTKNLPDYGCSAGDVYNYVDFETMIYHHRCKINADGSDTEVLSTEELIPIPDFFTIIPVEANGTIEFVNEYNLPVPNTVKYQKGAE